MGLVMSEFLVGWLVLWWEIREDKLILVNSFLLFLFLKWGSRHSL